MTDVVEESNAGSDAGLVRGWGGPECCHRHDIARSGLEPSGFMFSATLGRVNWLCNRICILYVVHTVRRNKHDVFLEKDFVEWAWSLRLKTNSSPSAVSCWRRDGVKGRSIGLDYTRSIVIQLLIVCKCNCTCRQRKNLRNWNKYFASGRARGRGQRQSVKK